MSYEASLAIGENWFVGEDKTMVFTIVDQNTSNLTPVDITGWSIVFEMSEVKGDNALITIPAAITDPTNGVCTVTSVSSDTIGLTGDQDYYYVLRHDDFGDEEELAFGTIYLRAVWVAYP